MPIQRPALSRALLIAALAVFPAAELWAQATATAVATTTPNLQMKEPELLALLRSDAPEADKALTCKYLAIHGSAAAVGDLAALLGNERLASWARIGLEAIPGPEADAALRKALETLSGRLLVGVINSLGVRRDAQAVGPLVKRLADPDAAVAAAAASALGRIATPEAGTALAGALAASGSPVARDAIAEACVVCAERLQAAGKRGEALALYDVVRLGDVSEQRKAEATRGAILVRGGDGIPLLVELLRSPVRRLANMGLFTARELGRGDRPDATLAAAVDLALLQEVAAGKNGGTAAERAALVIDVLAERNAGGSTAAVQSMLLESAASGPKSVRLAAVGALGRIGDAAVLAPLLAVAADPDPGFAIAAREAIAKLPGAAVDREIKDRLKTADTANLALLVGLVGDRRISAVAELVPLVGHGDAAVRSAAVKALGAVVDLPNLGVLIKQVVAAQGEADAAVARAALKEASVRMPDRDACAEQLAAAVTAGQGDTRIILLDTIGEVGGARALAALRTAAMSKEQSLEDAATRLLGKWMTADAAPVLLELAQPEAGCKFQTRALRGYIRIARQFVLPDGERAEMCRRALKVATDEVDQKAVLEILTRYPSAATLAVAEEAAARPGLEAEAKAAATAIKAKLPPTGR